jgi:zinc transport system substrate-binding protein
MTLKISKIIVIITFICISRHSANVEAKLLVFVSILPQQQFVQQIGKDLVDVRVMVAPGANPATYAPKPKQMAQLSKARIYFAIGVPFEAVWLKKIAAASPAMAIIHTERGIQRIPMAAHAHDDQNQHHAERTPSRRDDGYGSGLDPHIWLSPPLVRVQAASIRDALAEIDPAHGRLYAQNYEAFSERVAALHDRLTSTFSGKGGLRFMVFHPSWGYFARAYGIEQVPIEIEGKSPKPAQLQAVITQARASGIQVIFVQPQFSTKSAALVASAIGGRVAVADPLAKDWMANLWHVADQFSAALR